MGTEETATGTPTLESVARVAGVSRATVSRVINGIRNVDPQLREVVQRAVEATGYVPNQAARSLVTRRTGSIALVVSEAEHRAFDGPFLGQVFTDPFFGRVLTGLFNFLRPRGIHPVLMLIDTDEARTQLVNGLRNGHFDGVALVSLSARDPLPRLLAESGLPAASLFRPAEPIPLSYVDIIAQPAVQLAADHLVRRGCTRVATISGPLDTSAGQERLAGFRDAMARHGHAYIPSVEGAFTHESGEKAMTELLAEHPDIDGVFVANDLMAQGGLLVLHANGRRVPDDIAVIGFDDSSAALACRPPLTTVRQPLEDMAATMAELLLDRFERPKDPVSSVIFVATLIVRESA
jgi:DNA-binding LacI/PurR family transcriptional regulator